MPSQKPQILVRTSEETKFKLQRIAENNKRSVSNMAEIIIENYIENYEKKNGRVSIDIHHNETVNINN